jgi:hypothetical protein
MAKAENKFVRKSASSIAQNTLSLFFRLTDQLQKKKECFRHFKNKDKQRKPRKRGCFSEV